MADNCPNFTGKWKEITTESIEPILDLFGVPEPFKKTIQDHKHLCEIDHKGDKLTVEADTPMGKKVVEFVLDGSEQEIDAPFVEGTLKACPTWKDDHLITTVKTKNDKIVVMDRYMEGDKMIVDILVEDIKIKTVWEKC